MFRANSVALAGSISGLEVLILKATDDFWLRTVVIVKCHPFASDLSKRHSSG